LSAAKANRTTIAVWRQFGTIRAKHERPGELLDKQDVRLWQILLQKSFLGDERNFLGPLMRFVCGDVRDLIVSHKNDHGPSHRRYSALQR
jgi:hypothetical protein